MSSQEVYWNNVWAQSNKNGSYSYVDSRFERTLDKIGYFIQSGVIFKDGDKVLEAGCGDGLILLSLLRLFKIDGYGVDFSEEAKKRAEALMKEEGNHFNYDLANINELPYEENSFDKIICLGVIEHFKDQEKCLKELYRVLKPGGHVIMMTPNRLSVGVLDRVLKEAVGRWPFGYQTEFSPGTLEKKMRSAGFCIQKTEGILRKRLPNDNTTFKMIGYLDRVISLVVKDWGFYSYVFATKLGMDNE